MKFELGQRVCWIKSEYWSTHHPEDAGYRDVEHTGLVLNFSSSVVIVWSFKYDRPEVLGIFSTKWKEI